MDKLVKTSLFFVAINLLVVFAVAIEHYGWTKNELIISTPEQVSRVDLETKVASASNIDQLKQLCTPMAKQRDILKYYFESTERDINHLKIENFYLILCCFLIASCECVYLTWQHLKILKKAKSLNAL